MTPPPSPTHDITMNFNSEITKIEWTEIEQKLFIIQEVY